MINSDFPLQPCLWGLGHRGEEGPGAAWRAHKCRDTDVINLQPDWRGVGRYGPLRSVAAPSLARRPRATLRGKRARTCAEGRACTWNKPRGRNGSASAGSPAQGVLLRTCAGHGFASCAAGRAQAGATRGGRARAAAPPQPGRPNASSAIYRAAFRCSGTRAALSGRLARAPHGRESPSAMAASRSGVTGVGGVRRHSQGSGKITRGGLVRAALAPCPSAPHARLPAARAAVSAERSKPQPGQVSRAPHPHPLVAEKAWVSCSQPNTAPATAGGVAGAGARGCIARGFHRRRLGLAAGPGSGPAPARRNPAPHKRL
jgi:uncharacterized protein YwbE